MITIPEPNFHPLGANSRELKPPSTLFQPPTCTCEASIFYSHATYYHLWVIKWYDASSLPFDKDDLTMILKIVFKLKKYKIMKREKRSSFISNSRWLKRKPCDRKAIQVFQFD